MDRLRRDREGSFTLYDAVLFFLFLVIASTILMTYASESRSNDIDSIDNEYCETSRKAILSSTVPETHFIHDDEKVVREDYSIKNLLLEQFLLEKNGVPRINFSYDSSICDIVNEHIRDDYSWFIRLHSSYHTLIIGNDGYVGSDTFEEGFDENTVSSSSTMTDYDGNSIEITFFLYR